MIIITVSPKFMGGRKEIGGPVQWMVPAQPKNSSDAVPMNSAKTKHTLSNFFWWITLVMMFGDPSKRSLSVIDTGLVCPSAKSPFILYDAM